MLILLSFEPRWIQAQPRGPDLTQTYFAGSSSWGRGFCPNTQSLGINYPVTPWTKQGPMKASQTTARGKGLGYKGQSGLQCASHDQGCTLSPAFSTFISDPSQHPLLSPHHSQSPLCCYYPTPEMPSLPFKII